MKSVALIVVVIIADLLAIATTDSTQENVCNGCNCRMNMSWNSVQILSQLLEEKIAAGKVKLSWLTTWHVCIQLGLSSTGATYVRWGKSSCPSTSGTQLLYAGKAGGTEHNQYGGAAEKICLPADPEYLDGTAGFTTYDSSRMQGSEYEFHSGPNTDVYQYNVPCAVCFISTRATVIMVPAKTDCPSSWTREYYGYLTTESDSHHRSSFNCIDVNPEPIAGSGSSTNGALFYYTASTCTGLDCPPYENDRILSCTVCTKWGYMHGVSDLYMANMK